MPASVEERVIEKVRKDLLADPLIVNLTSQRVYASHISSVEEPKYPAISIHLLLSPPVFNIPEFFDIRLQIDCWLLMKQHNLADVMTLRKRVNAVLHRQNLIDTSVGVKVGSSQEVSAGPLLYEEDTGLYHYPMEYSIIAR